MSNDKTYNLFNDQGFLTKEGKAFVDDVFVKGLEAVLNIAKTPNEAIIIGSILSSVVGYKVLDKKLELHNKK